jgi:hypothetical protein
MVQLLVQHDATVAITNPALAGATPLMLAQMMDHAVGLKLVASPESRLDFENAQSVAEFLEVNTETLVDSNERPSTASRRYVSLCRSQRGIITIEDGVVLERQEHKM